MKSNLVPLSQTLSFPEQRAANALAAIGKGFLEAAAIIQGKPAGAVINGEASLLTVIELVNEFMLAKARAGKSDRYLRQLRVSFNNFKSGRGRAQIDTLTAPQLEKWIRRPDWSARTARNYLQDVRTLFNFAVKRGYLPRNPAAGVELPVLESTGKIQVHTPGQVKEVLDKLRRANLDVCRRLAIRYFAGVRSAEAGRLREDDLKHGEGLVQVSAEKSKTRSRRLVTIQPNLKQWLALGGELRPMSDVTVRETIQKTEVDWPSNVTRHSFCSYHLAHFKNAALTALEAGHSEAMLFKHYRALVTPQAAAEFWGIMP